MRRPSIITRDRCAMHLHIVACTEFRMEEVTQSGTIIQYYAPMCESCSRAYDRNPKKVAKRYLAMMKKQTATLRRALWSI